VIWVFDQRRELRPIGTTGKSPTMRFDDLSRASFIPGARVR
jgi:hypothetical protein